MMLDSELLDRINALERDIARLRRDLLRNLTRHKREEREKPSLFGSVRGGDVSEEMIEDAKRSLFRPLEDV